MLHIYIIVKSLSTGQLCIHLKQTIKAQRQILHTCQHQAAEMCCLEQCFCHYELCLAELGLSPHPAQA